MFQVVGAIVASAAVAFLVSKALPRDAPLHVTLPSWVPRFHGQVFDLTVPRALWGAVAFPWFALVAVHSLADFPPLQRVAGVIARMVLVGTVLLALARPVSTEQSARVCTVFLLDVSESVSDEGLRAARNYVARAMSRRDDDLARVITFAGHPRVVNAALGEHTAQNLPSLERHAGDGAASDLGAALALAYGLFPPGYLRHVVVLSDGVQTDGDGLAEAARAARLGVRVSVVPMRGAVPGEVAVRDLQLPDRIRVNEPFDVRAQVFANRPGPAALTLMQGEAVNGLDGNRVVDLARGVQEVRFRSVVRVPGDVTYSLRVVPVGDDRFRENNQFVATANVPGPPAVLYVEGDSAHAQYFHAALSGGDFEVEMRGAREVPQSIHELERFDFVVLSDVGAESVSVGSQAALARYVRELGGGFMMAGGPRGFGLGGWQGTEIERILPVRMESERRRDEPSVALTLVIDRSGSMQGTPLLLAQSAALAAARALGPDDLLEVIAFDSEPERIVRMQSARNRVRIENELRRLRPRGGTAIFPAIDAAAQDLAVTRATTRHVIVLTDGEGQPDEPPRIQTLVESMFGDGITVSAVGLGAAVNRPLLESIARRGHGRSYFTADANNLPQIFLRETNLVARSAAVEEPVLPRIVAQPSFVRELGGAPPYLYGYVSTRAKGDPAQVVLETDGANPEPLLARWRVGLGWSLAWTSDLKNRWAVEWVRWPRWAAFWTQVVREHMRQRQRHELGLRAELVGGRLHVAVDAISDGDRFDNGLTSELVVRGPQPGTREERLPMRQVAPGRYEVDAPLDRYGAFSLRAFHRRDGRVVAESRGQISNPYPREYAVLEPDVALLTAIAQATRGVVDPSPQQVWSPGADRVTRSVPRWPWAVGAAIVALVIDLLLRRVRLFDRGFRRR